MMMLLTVMPSSSSSSPSFPPRFASESLSLSARESVCRHVASPPLAAFRFSLAQIYKLRRKKNMTKSNDLGSRHTLKLKCLADVVEKKFGIRSSTHMIIWTYTYIY